MFNPIVREAVKQANVSGLKEIEDWLKIDAVKNKYSQPALQTKMDKQLERYGKRMMDIYRLVEKQQDTDMAF